METTTQLFELVKTSGLEVSKQNQIAETLGVFFNKAAEWDATIKSIVITSPEETGKMKMAKEGRLTLKNMRLEAEKIVKAKRDEVKYEMANYVLEDKLWLKAGQMMEATFKNLETKLEEKEKFAERWEAEQKEKLKAERLALLLPLGFQFENGFDLGNMDEQMFQSLKLGLETAKKEKEEAERKAEEERIAKEKADAEAIEQQRLENERLKAEAIAKEKELKEAKDRNEKRARELQPYIIFIRDYNTLINSPENEYLKEFSDIKKGAEDHWEFERKEQIRKQAEEERIKAKLKAEQEAKAKLEAELQAKKEAEIKAENERKEAELQAKKEADKLAKAPIKKQLTIWVDGFTIPEINVENDKKTLIKEKFESFKKWAKNEIELL